MELNRIVEQIQIVIKIALSVKRCCLIGLSRKLIVTFEKKFIQRFVKYLLLNFVHLLVFTDIAFLQYGRLTGNVQMSGKIRMIRKNVSDKNCMIPRGRTVVLSI